MSEVSDAESLSALETSRSEREICARDGCEEPVEDALFCDEHTDTIVFSHG